MLSFLFWLGRFQFDNITPYWPSFDGHAVNSCACICQYTSQGYFQAQLIVGSLCWDELHALLDDPEKLLTSHSDC